MPFQPDAESSNYQPTQESNWPAGLPDSVAAALDDLAARVETVDGSYVASVNGQIGHVILDAAEIPYEPVVPLAWPEGAPPSSVAQALEILAARDLADVDSVNGQIGDVTLETDDIPEAPGGPEYFTQARARAAAVTDAIVPVTDVAPSGRAVGEALAGKAPMVHGHATAEVVESPGGPFYFTDARARAAVPRFVTFQVGAPAGVALDKATFSRGAAWPMPDRGIPGAAPVKIYAIVTGKVAGDSSAFQVRTIPGLVVVATVTYSVVAPNTEYLVDLGALAAAPAAGAPYMLELIGRKVVGGLTVHGIMVTF